MEDCLKQCRPLGALQICLTGLKPPDASTSDIQLHPEDSELIIAQARSTAIKFHNTEEVRRLRPCRSALELSAWHVCCNIAQVHIACEVVFPSAAF